MVKIKCKFKDCMCKNKLYLNKCKYCEFYFCFKHSCLEIHNCNNIKIKINKEKEKNKKLIYDGKIIKSKINII